MLDVQLQWIRDLHEVLRSPWMDKFFIAWNYVDTIYFAVVPITLAMYLWDRKVGIRLLYLLFISFVLNKTFKIFFNQPRPCHIDPLVGILYSKNPGLPSGAAQSAVIYVGIVWFECRKKLYKWLAVIFAIVLCFSRVYLGLHYPTDILGGMGIGFALLLLYKKGFPYFEKRWQVASISFPILLLLLGWLVPSSSTWFFDEASALFGVATGLIMGDRIGAEMQKHLGRRALQIILVISGLALLFIAEKMLPSLWLLWAFAQGYWLSFLGGWLLQEEAFSARTRRQ
ncbi:MAG TPA: phosphatase PAP2 family protein [Rhabdochlamydiaceae bacterium]|nr:phosphatase PAP2 family protein [Rhabdochlamydiaceae bacterium]